MTLAIITIIILLPFAAIGMVAVASQYWHPEVKDDEIKWSDYNGHTN